MLSWASVVLWCVLLSGVQCGRGYQDRRLRTRLDSQHIHLTNRQISKISRLKSRFYGRGREVERSKRGAAHVDRSYYWPSHRIPYVVWPTLLTESGSSLLRRIHEAMYEIESVSCIRFDHKDEDDVDHVLIFDDPNECYSEIGRQGGVQITAVGPGCSSTGSVIHELLHTVGVWHTIARLDRDAYVTVFWDNLDLTYFRNFMRMSDTFVTWFNETYDTDSIMHYGTHEFSRAGLPTIVPKDTSVKIGQRRGLSEGDIRLLNLMYPCQEHGRCGLAGGCVSGVCRSHEESGLSECVCKDNWYGAQCSLQCSKCSEALCPDPRCNKACSNSRPCSTVPVRPKTVPLECPLEFCSSWESFESVGGWDLRYDRNQGGLILSTADIMEASQDFSVILKRVEVLKSMRMGETRQGCKLVLGYSYRTRWSLHSLDILVLLGHKHNTVWSTSLRAKPSNHKAASVSRDYKPANHKAASVSRDYKPTNRRSPFASRYNKPTNHRTARDQLAYHETIIVDIGARVNFTLIIRINMYESRDDFMLTNLTFEGCTLNEEYLRIYEAGWSKGMVLKPVPLQGYFPARYQVLWMMKNEQLTNGPLFGLQNLNRELELREDTPPTTEIRCILDFEIRTEIHIFKISRGSGMT